MQLRSSAFAATFWPTSQLLTSTNHLIRQPATRQASTAPLGYRPPKYEGPSMEAVKALRSQYMGSLVRHTAYRDPPLIHCGSMQWLFDSNGKRYLDMFGGIVTVSVGHCHPRVNDALKRQLDTIWHTSTVYMNPKVHEYAQLLASKMPGDLKSVYFVNSGSEANDLAMLIARVYTKNFELLSFRNAYHGMSPYTMGITSNSNYIFPLPGVSSGIQHVVNPDPYRGRYGGALCRDSLVQTTRTCDCSAGQCSASDEYFKELQETFKHSVPPGAVAGMFAESIQGVGGIIQFPKGYIQKAAELVRANGGIFVSDEVQTGFGRTGEHFWGFEGHGIIPDIVTMAKGIGNGFPIGAVVTTPKIAKSLNMAMHFNTFGGNPMASAVGIEVLKVIEEEKLQENCATVGNYILKGLEMLRNKYVIVGDVRGKGLMIGVEMVANKKTREPIANELFMKIWERTKDLGVLFGKGGFHGNVIRIKPPMCITKEDADVAVDTLEKAIKEFS